LSRIGFLGRRAREETTDDFGNSTPDLKTSASRSSFTSTDGSLPPLPFNLGGAADTRSTEGSSTPLPFPQMSADLSRRGSVDSVFDQLTANSSNAAETRKILKKHHDNQLLETGVKAEQAFVGTPDYLAPESILGTGQDAAVDWWALGVISYEFMWGYPPFHAATPTKVFENILARNLEWHDEDVDISHEAHELIDRLLTTNPAHRLGAHGAYEIKIQSFFQDTNWNSVYNEEPNFVPQVENFEDTMYFDNRGLTDASKLELNSDEEEQERRISVSSHDLLKVDGKSDTPGSSMTDSGSFDRRRSTGVNIRDEVKKSIENSVFQSGVFTSAGLTTELPTRHKSSDTLSETIEKGRIEQRRKTEAAKKSRPNLTPLTMTRVKSSLQLHSAPVSSYTNDEGPDFGMFVYKNLPLLEKANIEMVKKLRIEQPLMITSTDNVLTLARPRQYSLPPGNSGKPRMGKSSPWYSLNLNSSADVDSIDTPSKAPSAIQHVLLRRLTDSMIPRRNSMPTPLRVPLTSESESEDEVESTTKITIEPPLGSNEDSTQISLRTAVVPHAAVASGTSNVVTPAQLSVLASAIAPVHLHDCLIADDNPISSKILEVMLRKMSGRSVVVKNGAEAIRCAMGDIKFDVIFMDIHMPISKSSFAHS